MRKGNKMNSFLNGEWAYHGRPSGKQLAAKMIRKFKDMTPDQIDEIKRTYVIEVPMSDTYTFGDAKWPVE